MRIGIFLVLSLMAISSMLIFATEMAFAQNDTGANIPTTANTTNATSENMTTGNVTVSDTGASSAKTELEQGIRSLQNGDVAGARVHLMAAKEAMADAPPDAIRHFDEGMKAFDSGDNNGAIMHLNIADEALS